MDIRGGVKPTENAVINPQLECMVQELHDHQAILDQVDNYCRGANRMDRELLLSVYHPDAVADHGDLPAAAKPSSTGRSAITTRFRRRTSTSSPTTPANWTEMSRTPERTGFSSDAIGMHLLSRSAAGVTSTVSKGAMANGKLRRANAWSIGVAALRIRITRRKFWRDSQA
jgi:hypothetical protein